MSHPPVPTRHSRRVLVLVSAIAACGVLAGSALVRTKTGRVAPSDPAPRACRFRTAVVRCSDADVSDDYRFEITSRTDGALQMRIAEVTGATRERVEATFTRGAMAEARGVLTMSQANLVDQETGPEKQAWDGQHTRRVELDATAPPFVLSRLLTREAGVGRIEGLRFGGDPRPMAPLVRAGSAKIDLVVRGQPVSLDAERYATTRDAWPDSGELLLVRDIGDDREVNVVARLARGDTVVVELQSLE